MNFLSHLRPKHFNIRLKSSMTIYLSLVLVLIMALIFTLIESGRVSAVNARLRSITYMAADSSFAEFAQPVFDRYGIMLLWADEEEYLQKMNGYISENLNLKNTGAGMDLDFYGMRFTGSRLLKASWATDDGGEPFAKQVHEYMKVHVAESIMETLLSRTDFFEQTEKVRDLLGKLNEYRDEFVKVEQSAVEISNKLNHLKDLSENPKTLFEEMNAALDEYEQENSKEAADTFSQKKKDLEKSREEIAGAVEQMQQEADGYYKNVEEAKSGLLELKNNLDLDESEYDPEIYQALQDKMNEIETLGSEEGDGFRQIQETEEAVKQYQEKINELEGFFSGTAAELNGENLESYRELTKNYQLGLSEIDLGSLDISNAVPETEAADLEFITTVNNKYHAGLLDLLAGEVSEKQITRENFPSLSIKQDGNEENEEGIVDKTMQKALFSEYIAEHFGNFRSAKEDTALEYEAEYILAGKDNDRDNLSSVVTRLVLIRSGANLISLLLDNEKQAEIRELAAAISCGQAYIYKIAEGLITFVWALAEGMLDAKTLLDGKKVALLKQSGDWTLSLSGLQNFTGEEATNSDEQNGLGYEDYLRILLLMQNREKQRYRTMDMIQANMCQNENSEFRIKDCLVGITAEVEYHTPSVFAGLLRVQKTAGAESGGYEFRFTQEYAY